MPVPGPLRTIHEVEADFTKNLELLKRNVLNEEEFRKANETRRDDRVRLTGRQVELTDWLQQSTSGRMRLAPCPLASARSSATSSSSTSAGRRRCSRRS